MKIKPFFIFDIKKYISISIIPILDFEFANYYKYYQIYLTLGWLMFGVSFELKINKNN
jgi:hypothetical protein